MVNWQQWPHVTLRWQHPLAGDNVITVLRTDPSPKESLAVVALALEDVGHQAVQDKLAPTGRRICPLRSVIALEFTHGEAKRCHAHW